MNTAYQSPLVATGCDIDESCPEHEACYNGQCQNPCSYQGDPCGLNAECVAKMHRSICKCREGWAGNPSQECFTCKWNLGHKFRSYTLDLENN